MKKAFFIGFLSLLIVAKMIYGFVWHMHFYANQKAIIAQECINKNRPKMNCNGTCYLAKQLKKADLELEKKKGDQERSLNQLKVLESAEYVNVIAVVSPVILGEFRDDKKSRFPYLNTYNFSHFFSLFHPPSGVVHS